MSARSYFGSVRVALLDDHALVLKGLTAHLEKSPSIVIVGSHASSRPFRTMLANMPVTDESLQNLAEQRAENVRKYLAAKVDPNRLFVVAPKLDSKGIDDKDKTTRVDFSLK